MAQARSFVLAAVLTAAMAAPAAAQDISTDAAREAIEACLESTLGGPDAKQACRGAYSGPCMEQPDGDTTYGMSACSGAEYEAWDEILNDRYRQLRERWNELDFADLQAAQRAWLAWRDAECAINGDPERHGTLAGVNRAGCMSGMTARRALVLDDMLYWNP